MRQTYQTILLIDHVAEAVDSIVEACNQADLPPVKISTAFNSSYALKLLDENEFSLVIVGLSEELGFAELELLAEAHEPKPLLSLLVDDSSENILMALRKGASDVFIQSEVAENDRAFCRSITKLLIQAEMVEKNLHYREELEKSLGELQADQQAARQIQQNMLPDNDLKVGGIQAKYLLIPSLYLSGDFVDVISVDETKTLFYLADVSGHGASSALVTVLLKNMTNRLLRNFRRRSSFDILSPIDVLYRINSELLDTELGKHLSIFIGLFDGDDSSLAYAVGGHHPMPILTDNQGSRYLEGRGMPVGLFPEPMFEERKLFMKADFELTMFSDGILEVLPQSDMTAKEQRLIDAVVETKGGGPDRIKDVLLPGIIEAAPDDIAIMTICRQ
ncbi:SpoIIE family protein phosphatase [uncultured Neptuniibacter sp.]|uniref:SpoIIE family protein phosphatase n=1 Tax=uncultured Neptuniibacter sp. TaxID=502143 RepID=UPI002618D598|nr:SpoIIE family protein phosphatase [uncultured Neptuniibacter sp.]